MIDMPNTISEAGEFETLRRIWEILGEARGGVILGLGDDAAVVEAPSRPVVLTVDAMIEGVHFLQSWCGAEDLAHKILASNLSDLAAKCAAPRYTLITLGLPGETRFSWVEDFYYKMADLSKVWEVDAIGGDLVKSENIIVSLTAWGEMATPMPIRINGARPGDALFVTGTLGDAVAGLEILLNGLDREGEDRAWLIQRLLRPAPRVKEAMALAKLARPSSMTDISDGLARDLRKLCAASGAGAVLEEAQLPCSEALNDFTHGESASYAWNGGEDFELLFTISPENEDRLLAEWDTELAPISRIGRIEESEGIRWQDGGSVLEGGFEHFR